MAVAILVDTSGYTAFKRGHPAALAAIRATEQILLSTVVLGELLAGFAAGTQRERNRSELDQFLTGPRVMTVPVTAITAERYAHIYLYLRTAGKPIPTNDLWIAAAAFEHGAELLTADGHFSYVPQVVVRQIG